jgi:adenylosuccinate lyase
MLSQNQFTSPLNSRYASKDILFIFSNQMRATIFRSLWLELAKAQKKLGLKITDAQIDEIKKNITNIDFQKIHNYEEKFRHDVVAHIYAFSDVCPTAKPIIHLGATSCFITDNADLIIMKKGLYLILAKLINIIDLLSNFAKKEAQVACVGYTHFQPAQPTTVGKRACLWLQDLMMDFNQGNQLLNNIPFLGAKGATGTQASFMNLFNNDEVKVKLLDEMLASAFQFKKNLIISGQTYSRKIDCLIMQFLENTATTLHKMATDLRLLAHLNEIQERFEDDQVGSSAMPHKKNPIYSERVCSLARFLISLAQNPIYTAANQWLERTLDDSANRRLSLSEGFLTADSICNIIYDTIQSLFVNHEQIKINLNKQLPNLCLENILMMAVKKGADRQEIHEKIRQLSNDPLEIFFEKIANDPKFGLTIEELKTSTEIKNLVGRAESQVHEFFKKEVFPLLNENKHFQVTFPALKI